MWKVAAAVKDEWRAGLASGGETFLEKSFSPEPPFPKAFDWWGGRAEGVRSDMRGTFMGGPSNRLHLWDVADRDAISVKALQIHQPAREEVAYADGSDLAVFVEFPHRSP